MMRMRDRGARVMIDVGQATMSLLQTVRATADVIEVEESDEFRASVYLGPNGVAVARLNRSLRGAQDEGEVLRRVMLTTTGLHGAGYFEFLRA